MTILIDDSGWGCPIGSTIIGALRAETGEYAYVILPIEQFQGEKFAHKEYLEGARAATENLLGQLKHLPEEPIRICTGYVHTATRQWLGPRGYNAKDWNTTKIEGELQILIERTLRDYLKSLGFELHQSTEKYGSLFFEAMVWLKGGNPNTAGMLPQRMAVAKTGWGTFQWHLHT